jgi:hypothetical protein
MRELATAFARIEPLNARTEALARMDPLPGSLAAGDITVPHARFVLINAGRALAFAIDHLRAWAAIAHGGVMPIFAPMTLLRSSLESASLARWLVEPAIDARTRVARGVAYQLQDHEERNRFEAAGEILAPPGGKSAKARKDDLLTARERDGLPVVEVERPTSLARRYGPPGRADRSWLYRLASAFTHGREWALLATNLGEGESAGEGIGRGYLSANEVMVAGATTLTVSQVERAIEAVESYVGLKRSG